MSRVVRSVTCALRLPGGSRLRFRSLHGDAAAAAAGSAGSSSEAPTLPAAPPAGAAAGDHTFAGFRSHRIAQGTQVVDSRAHSRHRSRELRLATAEVHNLGKRGRWQEALVVFGTVPEPDPILRTAVMSACSRSLQLSQARQLFAEMPEKTVAAYNVMILLLGKLRLEQEASDLMAEMRGQCLRPNETTYTSLMTAHGVVQDSAAAAGVLEEMVSAGIAPSAASYGAAMTACGRAGDVARAKDLMAQMVEKGLEPDAGHFSSLITAHARAGDEAGALEALNEMRRRGLRPSVVSYTSLLAGISGPNALARAEEVFAEMQREGIEPDTLAYNALLSAAIASKAPKRFWQVLAEMESRGVPSNEQTERRVTECQALEERSTKGPAEGLAEAPLPPGWQETHDPASGRTYYWAEADPAGTTTWVRPS